MPTRTAVPRGASALDHVDAGIDLLGRGEWRQAVEECTMAIERDPREALGYACRGQAYVELVEYDLAISDLTRAIELDPSAEFYAQRAVAKHAAGDTAGAEADLEQALTLATDPEVISAIEEMCLFLLGRDCD